MSDIDDDLALTIEVKVSLRWLANVLELTRTLAKDPPFKDIDNANEHFDHLRRYAAELHATRPQISARLPKVGDRRESDIP